MVVRPKTEEELIIMREAGRMLGEVLAGLADMVEPGISTKELDVWAEKKIRSFGAVPTFKGYGGFPATLCTSVNEAVVHGIPSKRQKLREGDIIGIDCGVTYMGYVSDSAITLMVGEVEPRTRKLVEVTKQSLDAAIRAARVGNTLGDIGHAVQSLVESHGFSVVRDLTGHGVGRELHEPPQVLNYGRPGTGMRIPAGMTIAIEPMINMGTWKVKTLKDGWTVVTADGLPSAHFEHTIAIHRRGVEILSLRPSWSKV
jgi:methionyl aminopeptidase